MTERVVPKRVMIVEDEALVALTLEDVLTEAGYNVCGIADRPVQALEIARVLEPDIAIVDVRLAEGGDGIALAATLAAPHADLDPVRHRQPGRSPRPRLCRPWLPVQAVPSRIAPRCARRHSIQRRVDHPERTSSSRSSRFHDP